jgi:hypothetical protein
MCVFWIVGVDSRSERPYIQPQQQKLGMVTPVAEMATVVTERASAAKFN